MPKPSEYDKTHLRNMAAMGTRIDRIFKKATEEAAKIGVSIKDVDPDKVFSFDDYPETKKQIERLLQALKDTTETTIANGVRSAWTLSNNKNNALASHIFGDNVGKLTKEQYRQYFSTNDNALQAFLQRQTNGLNLSDRVWKYTNAFKSEIELGLDLGIRSGLDAPKMARELKQYLQHPDKLFRRVRDEHGNLQLSKAAAEFHPGRGVYRSSYKNARRLAATETNIAYRTSDHLRWQQMDFVVGIEIKTSNNHTLLGQDGKPHPFYDICDTLAGKYPKDFKFTGWHPHCRCHVETILKTEEEMMADNERILAGEDVSETSENTVKEVPQAFKDHIEKYAERIEQTAPGRLPYYIQDNRQRIDKMLGTQPQLSPQEIAAERHAARTPQDAQSIQERWNRSRLNALQEAINNGYLPEDCKARLAELAKLNTPEHFDDFQAQIKTLQNAAARHAARTEAQAAAIQTRWDEKLFRDAKTQRDANRVLTLAKSYSEVDYAQLEKLIAQNNLTAMDAETQKVLQALKDMRAEERALQDLIPNVHDWHKQFTLAELKEAHKGIEDTIEFWKTKYGADLAAKTNLTKLQSELEQKIKFVEDPGAFKAGAVQKKYWQVQQAGYKQQLTLTKNEIWLQETTKDYNDLLGFKTKSADFKFYMEKAKEAIDKGNAADAHHYIDLANWKKNSLEARRKTATAVAGKPGGVKFAESEFTAEKKKNALWFGGKLAESDAQIGWNEADAYMTKLARENWLIWNAEQREVAFLYTSGSRYINEPLYSQYYGVKVGLNGVRRNSWKDINTLTHMIDKAVPLPKSMWVQHGEDFDAFEARFGIMIDLADKAELKSLIGKTAINTPFTSAGCSKYSGFAHHPIVMNIYCPAGTKGIYTEPFSFYGDNTYGNAGYKWTGDARQALGIDSSYENEIILQRGSKFRITKITYNKSDKKWYVDCDLVEQPEKIDDVI